LHLQGECGVATNDMAVGLVSLPVRFISLKS